MTGAYHYHRDGSQPLDPNAIFVFGSNLAGQHLGGAARAAHESFGARLGIGSGSTGRAYALPTMDVRLQVLPVDSIRQYVRDFLRLAESHPTRSFFVTRVGCGIAGYRDQDIAPLFRGAPTNCNFPEEWKSHVE